MLGVDRALWSWGTSRNGSLGLDIKEFGVTKIEPSKLDLGGKKRVNLSCLASGWDHVLVLMEDGSIWAWGGNSAGQLGTGDTNAR
jgi:alpha-tubulin suppressor-like RCC1 family protein